ncbi:phosphoribosylamine--glycine ligase [Xanthobacter oligotrophicus]|uniref:phosphoribosylamine--glycine ligase n=1 Tax=Xanthobacter oligotrophicus TaxID=2607286 RepID=UPI0011F30160|nr:phosphoribosylamine--glycine ligase [Xanthobacter oligotrophicus]MCG5236504.1 phosphoribosylamine--glycine ligase [Xanthobacter oligotrophicus]
MNILLLGSGGREHALAWKLAQSPSIGQFYAIPGNPGIAEHAELIEGIPLSAHDTIVKWCQDHGIGFVVVGPEAPLVAGLVDRLEAVGIPAFGPTAAAARLEGSKLFTKELCKANSIPTAAFGRFTSAAEGAAYVRQQGAPIVVKADGLMAGKGVVVALSEEEAVDAVEQVFAGGGTEVLIEEFMEGEEASLFALVDGETVVLFGSAQDHKRAFDGDLGPNTGGMGAYSPAPVLTPELERRALEEILIPTARAMVAAGAPYRGVLYAGLMLTADGPKLVEYNCRFGDPECQVLMPRFTGDLVQVLHATATGHLAEVTPEWSQDAAMTVVYASRGYPGPHQVGSPIGGLDAAAELDGVLVFQAGTRRKGVGLVSNGGRVLNVTATGATLGEARDRAYAGIARIEWPDGFYRSDIGWRALGKATPGKVAR